MPSADAEVSKQRKMHEVRSLLDFGELCGFRTATQEAKSTPSVAMV